MRSTLYMIRLLNLPYALSVSRLGVLLTSGRFISQGIVPTMIIVLASLGLTTTDLNSDSHPSTRSNPDLEFRTTGQTFTTNSLYEGLSMRHPDVVYMEGMKPRTDSSVHMDSPDTAESKQI